MITNIPFNALQFCPIGHYMYVYVTLLFSLFVVMSYNNINISVNCASLLYNVCLGCSRNFPQGGGGKQLFLLFNPPQQIRI